MDGATREMTPNEIIESLFTFHPPEIGQVEMYTAIREKAKALAREIVACCPSGPDRTAAIRKVREAVMTANASIATRNAAAGFR